jgi:hypothetical protein
MWKKIPQEEFDRTRGKLFLKTRSCCKKKYGCKKEEI